MLTTHTPGAAVREAVATGKQAVASTSRRPASAAETNFDPTHWQRILQNVRLNHPSLNRVWFDQMAPRQLTNGVIQVLVPTPAQMNFCQGQCQQPFTAAAQSVTGRLVAVSFHCNNLPRAGNNGSASTATGSAGAGGVFDEGDRPLPLNPDYVFEKFVTGPSNRRPHPATAAVGHNPGHGASPH